MLRSRALLYLGILSFCLSLASSPAAFASPADEPTSQIFLSASITPTEKRFSFSGDKFGLRINFSDIPPIISPKAGAYLPLGALFKNKDDVTLKNIEVVVWTDPRYFSLHSQRHGLLDLEPVSVLGQHEVMALLLPEADEAALRRLRLQVREDAPNGVSTVGILLFADYDLVAEFALPLRVSKGMVGLEDGIAASPFRPEPAMNRVANDDGVLTIIELHPGQVQFTFGCKYGIQSWRVVSDFDSLKEWPQYVNSLISSGVSLETVASTFSDILFPVDSRCKPAGCAAASTLFNTWTRNLATTEQPHSLKVQALPIGQDETFSTIMIPVGVLPVLNSVEDEGGQSQQQSHSADQGEPNIQATAFDAQALSASPKLVVTQNGLHQIESASHSTIGVIDDPADLDIRQLQLLMPEARGEPLAVIDHSSFFDDPVRIFHEGGEESEDYQEPLAPARETANNDAEAGLEDPASPEQDINRQIFARADPSESKALHSRIEASLNLLAHRVVVNVPLYRTNDVASKELCAQAWSVLLPPQIEEGAGLDKARKEMSALTDVWNVLRQGWYKRGVAPAFHYKNSIEALKRNDPPPTSAWLIVSHYNNKTGILQMPHVHEFVGAGDLKRKLAPPGVVLLLACEGAVPADHKFLSNLIRNGVRTLITSNAPLSGDVAGQFAQRFIEVLGEAGTEGISARDALWETLRRLDAQDTVPRFVLAGDPMIKICAPPLLR